VLAYTQSLYTYYTPLLCHKHSTHTIMQIRCARIYTNTPHTLYTAAVSQTLHTYHNADTMCSHIHKDSTHTIQRCARIYTNTPHTLYTTTVGCPYCISLYPSKSLNHSRRDKTRHLDHDNMEVTPGKGLLDEKRPFESI
jgi:hypothetical protein